MADAQDTDMLIPEAKSQADDADKESEAGSIVSETSLSSTRSGLTYKKLSDRVFFWAALILHCSMLFIAITATNIEPVFDFLGAFGCNSITFLFPGVGYLVALKKFGNSRIRKSWETTCN